MISLICCYNNAQMFRENIVEPFLLLRDIVEVIGINNTSSTYSSAAEAFNDTVPKCNGDILVFIHQDIMFEKEQSISDFLKYMEYLGDNEIGGIAGTKYKLNDNMTMVLEGDNDDEYHGINVDSITECDTIDECMFAMTRNTWDKYRFNERVCNGWHLYAVEFCIRIKTNNGKVVLLPIHGIRHLSSGKIDYNYLRALRKLIHEYNDLPYIWTSCTKIETDKRSLIEYFFDRYLKVTIKKLLRRQ